MTGLWIINSLCEDCHHNELLEAHDFYCDCWCHDDGGSDDDELWGGPGSEDYLDA